MGIDETQFARQRDLSHQHYQSFQLRGYHEAHSEQGGHSAIDPC